MGPRRIILPPAFVVGTSGSWPGELGARCGRFRNSGGLLRIDGPTVAEIGTCGLRIRSPLLYPAELRGPAGPAGPARSGRPVQLPRTLALPLGSAALSYRRSYRSPQFARPQNDEGRFGGGLRGRLGCERSRGRGGARRGPRGQRTRDALGDEKGGWVHRPHRPTTRPRVAGGHAAPPNRWTTAAMSVAPSCQVGWPVSSSLAEPMRCLLHLGEHVGGPRRLPA